MMDMAGISFHMTRFSFQFTNQTTIGYFIICPANQEIAVSDSLYETTQWHVTIFDNLVKFLHDYQKSKDIPEDRWAWHMHPVVVKKKNNNDDCGVCLSLAIYCVFHGLDCLTMP
jgi:hypothetical protein